MAETTARTGRESGDQSRKLPYQTPKIESQAVFEVSALVSCGKTTAEANNPFHPLSQQCSTSLSGS
ncbi:MAG: hypothetical protein HYT87_10700 [Nitrospirae bacterium]|nr:hypothetical protein [Nitrospirota bacterium]